MASIWTSFRPRSTQNLCPSSYPVTTFYTYLQVTRNVVLVGGTGTGKTHLAIAIARACIRQGARGQFFTVVDLVNRLEAEGRSGRQGRLAENLCRKDFVVLDSCGLGSYVELRHGVDF